MLEGLEGASSKEKMVLACSTFREYRECNAPGSYEKNEMEL